MLKLKNIIRNILENPISDGFCLTLIILALYLPCINVLIKFYPKVDFVSNMEGVILFFVIIICIIETNFFTKIRVDIIKETNAKNKMDLYLKIISSLLALFFATTLIDFGFYFSPWSIFYSILFIIIFTYVYYRAKTDPVDKNLK